MTQRLTSQLHLPYTTTWPTRKRALQRVVAAVNHATLSAITPSIENQMDLYEDVKKRRRVESLISPNHEHTSSFWIAVINEWNNGNRYQRKQLAALLSRMFAFEEINKFNPKKKNAIREALREASGTASDSDDGQFVTDGQGKKHYFIRPFTRYMYRQGQFHVLKTGQALAPAKSRGYRLHRVSKEMLAAIYSFITSNEVTKATAFDTYQIRKSTGETHFVAKNIRNYSKEELVRKLQEHLRGLKFDEEKIPGRSYMLKIINSLPAKKARQMRGISIAVDEGKMTTFNLLKVLKPNYFVIFIME